MQPFKFIGLMRNEFEIHLACQGFHRTTDAESRPCFLPDEGGKNRLLNAAEPLLRGMETDLGPRPQNEPAPSSPATGSELLGLNYSASPKLLSPSPNKPCAIDGVGNRSGGSGTPDVSAAAAETAVTASTSVAPFAIFRALIA